MKDNSHTHSGIFSIANAKQKPSSEKKAVRDL